MCRVRVHPVVTTDLMAESQRSCLVVGPRAGRPALASPHVGRRALLALASLVALTPLISGCRGCTRADPLTEEQREARREELRKQKEKEKPDFEFLRFSVRPNQTDRIEAGVKPGHWTTGSMEARANNFEYRGELASELLQQGRPVDLDQMPFRLRVTRPAILPKGQRRVFEYPLYSPLEVQTHQISTRLLSGPGGRTIVQDLQPLERMPAHQYYFAVLARNPDLYGYLRTLDSIRAPRTDMGESPVEAHYRVILPKIRNRAALPNGALSWTAVACILWDDLDPKLLAPDKQQALLDWLHWGGQLIVSGPETLDTVRGSFLDPYLPADGGDALKLDTGSLAEINSIWTISGRPLTVVEPWTGQKLTPRASSQILARGGGEPLVVARRVGRGRVVVTAFHLSQRELRNWPGFDGFFNGCILARPPRVFSLNDGLTVRVDWTEGDPYDASRVSHLRYFTRDAALSDGSFAAMRRQRPEPASPAIDEVTLSPWGQPMYIGDSSEGPPVGPGVAAWDDFSTSADLASYALREAAGIVVPEATFVVWVLAVYVVVLVPVNWAFFRMLGRVELAWAVAPLIAVGCSLAVVYLAQLDIGFARSRTDLSVIEVQGEHPRAHLTRYIALYSSLGTSYRLRFEDDTALALPFPTGRQMLSGTGRSTVGFRRVREAEKVGAEDEISEVTLEGLAFDSNTTGMVHTEQMYDLGGGVRWEALGDDRFRLTNLTNLTLEGAGVVGKDKAAWVGSLPPAAQVEVRLVPANTDKLWTQERGRSLAAPSAARSDKLNLLNLRNLLALAQKEVPAGELRLVAWTPDEIGGLTIRPAASQKRHRGLFVAHLDYGPLPAPQRDQNDRATIQGQLRDPLPPEELDDDLLPDENP